MNINPDRMQPPVFGITGWKNSGKTSLVAALVEEFTRRGLIVSTVKHAHHNFDIDQEGTDSFKHRQAGAREVALVSSKRFALMHELGKEDEPPLEEILARLSPCDLVLIEGYKREPHPKLETIRLEATKETPLWTNDPSIMALATRDEIADCPLPVFSPDNVTIIADFIAEHLKLDLSRKQAKQTLGTKQS